MSNPHPFIVKHYSSDERPTIKGNGFDGLEIGEDRQEAEEFCEWINARLCTPLPQTESDTLRLKDPVKLAQLFHDTYEQLAPEFNYETRLDTKVFDPSSPNGKLMTAVCTSILTHYTTRPQPVAVSERLPELRGMFERILCVARPSGGPTVGNIQLAERLIDAVVSWSGNTLPVPGAEVGK